VKRADDENIHLVRMLKEMLHREYMQGHEYTHIESLISMIDSIIKAMEAGEK
jgi:tRNA C32,U32 (ribose-2'-O)-methylase TrmJ